MDEHAYLMQGLMRPILTACLFTSFLASALSNTAFAQTAFHGIDAAGNVGASEAEDQSSQQSKTQHAERLKWRLWSDAVFVDAKREKRFVLLDLEAVWCH